MLPNRPDIREFARIVDELADLQDALNKKEYVYEKRVAQNLRVAMQRGAKTRELDHIKILGNNETEEAALDNLMTEIHELKRAVRIKWGAVEAWKADKELYKSDSFHLVGGRGGFIDTSEDNEGI